MGWAAAISHRVNAQKFLGVTLFLLAILTLMPSTSLADDAERVAEEVLLEVSINQIRKDTVLLLRSSGRLYAGAQDLRRWRVRLPNTTPLTFDGENFYALDALEGVTYR